MGKYILQREDGKYVTPAGSEKSYTYRLQKARIFDTRAEAERERCGNERIVSLEDAARG